MIDYKVFKEHLAQKFKDEQSGFTKRDIKKVATTKDGFIFQVGDYTHIAFKVYAKPENDEFMRDRFGKYFVCYEEYYTEYPDEIEYSFGDWCNDLGRMTESLALSVGYHICNTF